jgi:hypothetical protein
MLLYKKLLLMTFSMTLIDVALLSETHLKRHERFYIPNYHFYRSDRFLGKKGGTAIAVRKGIPHNHVDLPPLVSVEVTGVCIPIGNSEVLLAVVYKSPGRAWSDADITELFSCRRKSILADDQNASGVKLLNLLLINEFEISAPHVPLITLPQETVTCSILLCTRMSGCQKPLSLTFCTQLTYQLFSTCWIILEVGIFWTRSTNLEIGSSFIAWPLN